MSKLGLNQELIAKARASAHKVAADVQAFIDEHTTVTVERAVCRLLGIDGVNEVEVPLPNVVVDHLKEKGVLSGGVAFYVGNAMVALGVPQEIAEKVSSGEVDLTKLPVASLDEIKAAIWPIAEATTERVSGNVAKRNEYLESFGGDKEGPFLLSDRCYR